MNVRIFAIIGVFLVLLGCDNKNANVKVRNVGESLDGTWYIKSNGGCFHDTGVILIVGNKSFIHVSDYSILYAFNIEVSFDGNIITYKHDVPFRDAPTKVARQAHQHFIDHGEYLEAIDLNKNIKKDIYGRVIKNGLKDMVRCSSPTFLSKIQLILGVKKPYKKGHHRAVKRP